MSNTFYNLIARKIVDYFEHSSLKPGEKFHIQFEHLNDVEQLFSALKNESKVKGFYKDFIWGIEEPYKSFSIEINELSIIIASTLNGVTPAFLTKLRNLVGTQEPDFKNRCIVFIHNTTLDSIVGGAVGLQDTSMPLSKKAIEAIITTAIAESELDQVAKDVLSFAFSKIGERTNDTHYSIFEYEEILSAISAGVSLDHYQSLGLFYDEALKGYDHKAREERLKENYELFKFIHEVESFGDMSNDLEKKFDEEGINTILNKEWKKIDFRIIKQSHHNKVSMVPPTYIEELLKVTNEGLEYWERAEGQSKAKNRKRHLIIFNPSQTTDISLSLSFDSFLKKENLQNQAGAAASISGKKIKVSYKYETGKVNFFSFLYKESGATFDFKIAVVPFVKEFFTSIQSSYLIECKRNKRCIKVLHSKEQLVLNNEAEYAEREIIVNAELEEVHVEIDECLKFVVTEDYFQKDNQIFALKIGDIELPIAFISEKIQLTRINGVKAFQLTWERKQHLLLKEGRKVLLGNEDYLIDDQEFFLSLEEERQFIEQEALYVEQENGIYTTKDLNVPEKLQKAYLNYLSYFKARNLLPSLSYWNEDIIELARHYIESFLEVMNELEEGFALSKSQQDLSKIGILENKDSLHAVKYSPFHPINIIHKYLFMKKVNDSELPLEIIRRLSPTFLVPYIYHNNKIYKAVNQSHSLEWTYYYDYKGPRYNSSSTFVSKLITDKIKEFKQHYSYLFLLNKNAPLKINVINLGDCKEVLQGIFAYYITELKRGSLEDLIPIQITIYENFNTINAFEEFSFYDDIQEIESNFGVKFKNEKYAPEDILNVFRSKVEFYRKNYTDNTFDYCHITFFESDEDVDETIDQTDKIGTGLSLSGLFSALTSTYLGDSYRTGFGTRYLGEQESLLIEFIKLYNSLVLASGRQNTFEKGKAIVTAFSNQGKKKLESIYESSHWVTFIEPKFDLNYFGANGEEDILIIHYSDQYTPSSNYDAITVTRKVGQFKMIIEEMLVSKSVEVKDETIKDIINLFNTVNGDWLLRMIGSKSQFPREKISLLSAVKFTLAYLQHRNIIWVPLSLEEILRVSGAVGLNQKDGLFSAKNLNLKGSVSDDLLLIGFEVTEENIKVHLYPIEVKIGKNGGGVVDKAISQVTQTSSALRHYLSENTFKSSVYKNFLIQLAITNVKKMKVYEVLENQEWDVLLSEEVRVKLLDEQYDFVDDLFSYLGYGAVISFESDNYFRKAERVSDTLLIRLTEKDGYEYLTFSMDHLFNRIHEAQEDYPLETLLLSHYKKQEKEMGSIEYSKEENILSKVIDLEGEGDCPEEKEVSIPPVVESCSDPLKVLFGHSASSNESLYWYPTTTSKIMHTNTGIIGTMGTGKTQFTKSLIKQLYDSAKFNVNKTPVDILIFDYKGDYIKDDFVEATNATVYQPYHLPYNPLALYRGKQPKPLLPLHTASTIKETIANAFNLGIKQQQLLNDLIVEAYSHSGIHKANMSTWQLTPPTLNNVFERYMDREEVKEDSLYAALKQIYDFEIFSPDSQNTMSLYDMVQGVTVVHLAGYDQSIQNLIVGITLDTFYSQMSTKGHSTIQGDYRELTKMVLVDEADNFLSQNFSSLKKIMKEGREYGVGVILSTQFLDHFATADNDYAQYILTWIIHRVPTIKKKEVQAIFSPENQAESEQIANKIAQLQKHKSLVTSVTKNRYEVMEDMAFWKLLN
ncbi:DNA phosphorothioation-dependent restriction protein DptH [Priestia megaterium]